VKAGIATGFGLVEGRFGLVELLLRVAVFMMWKWSDGEKLLWGGKMKRRPA